MFSAFTAALSHVQLSALQFVSCDEVTVGQLKCVLEQINTLKYCDIQCNLESVLDKHVFAELANHLVGEANLSLNNLEAVPSNLLRFKRSAYRATIVTLIAIFLNNCTLINRGCCDQLELKQRTYFLVGRGSFITRCVL